MTALLLVSLGVVAWRGGVLDSLTRTRRASVVLDAGDHPTKGNLSVSKGRATPALSPAIRDLGGDLLAVQRLVRLGYPLYCGGSNGRFVALTFDDGPGAYTLKTLDILRHAGARATFFLVGRNLAWYPGRVQQEAPNNAVGDHTWTHAYLTSLPLAQQEKEIDDTRRAVAEATQGQVVLFRPPGAFHNASIDTLVSSYGMLEVLWSADSLDSQGAHAPEVLAAATAALKPGAIILMHENRGTTLQILPELLRVIREQGFQTVTVPELLRLDSPTAEQMRKNAAVRGCAG